MTGKSKRVQVTLSPEAWALVDEVHELTGTPKSAVVAEVVDWVLPVLMEHIEAIRIAQERPREAQRIVANQVSKLLGMVGQAQLDLDAAIDGRTVKGKRIRRDRDAGAT